MGYWLSTEGDFKFAHDTWDKLRSFALLGGEVKQRTIYNRVQSDYLNLLKERFGESTTIPQDCLIFEAWRGGDLQAVAFVALTTFLNIHKFHITKPGKDTYCDYAIMYELINFAKHNLCDTELYDGCIIDDPKAFNI